MQYRFIMALVCFISLQSNALPKDQNVQTDILQPETDTTYLPYSEPTTPKEKYILRRVQTDYNFLYTVSLRKNLETEKISLMKKYIKELQEQKLAEEKRLAEETYKKWLQYVRESNSCGFFPHSGIVHEINYVSNHDADVFYP